KMWKFRQQSASGGRTIVVTIERDSTPASYAEVLASWERDRDFRAFFNAILADSPFAAFRWETPPITTSTARQPFEFVLLDSPALARSPDPEAFADHFPTAPPSGVIAFPNLGGDAIMVVPAPRGPISAYGHIGAFVRHAPEL